MSATDDSNPHHPHEKNGPRGSDLFLNGTVGGKAPQVSNVFREAMAFLLASRLCGCNCNNEPKNQHVRHDLVCFLLLVWLVHTFRQKELNN